MANGHCYELMTLATALFFSTAQRILSLKSEISGNRDLRKYGSSEIKYLPQILKVNISRMLFEEYRHKMKQVARFLFKSSSFNIVVFHKNCSALKNKELRLKFFSCDIKLFIV